MDFLKAAEDYARARYDWEWFAEVYSRYRETESVKDSVIYTMIWLYGRDCPLLDGHI
jgi:hypothetical protein